MTAQVVPRWEWRTFGEDFGAAESAFAALTAERVEESDELYVLATASDASVKVRAGHVDVKSLQAVDDNGLEQWLPVAKRAFPVSRADIGSLLAGLQVPAPLLELENYGLDDFTDAVVRVSESLVGIGVHKRRVHYTVGGCMAELSEIRTDAGSVRSIAIESPDPARVLAAVRALGLESRVNVCMGRGLKTLVGFGAKRFAVIDVGTNSVKLHLGERRADGTWSTIVDRAAVTRLGEGLDATGSLGATPMERTTQAIAEMADESRRAGAAVIVAVGTAGMRAADNAAAFVSAVESRCDIRIEIIPGGEEARLAFLAAKVGLGRTDGAVVVFDTGGGSSQFTFGRGDEVEDQFSVPVGSVRLTERYGLAASVSEQIIRDVLADVASAVDRLDAHPNPAVLVGMGGALTNLAAVKLGLATYDPEVVHGTRLDRAEIDRQLELYRTRSTDERRSIVGLQRNRAEVILAGACVVRAVLTKLGCDSLVVSDRGLRHGLIADRFALGPPSG